MGRGMVKLGGIGAGITGGGMVGAAVDHAGDIAQVSGVWDQAPAAVERIGAALPGVARAGSASEVINGAECVYVATPPSSHLDYAGQALAAGKAVFLEKPLSVDVAAADAFARRHGADRVAINFPFASSLAVQRLRDWM